MAELISDEMLYFLVQGNDYRYTLWVSQQIESHKTNKQTPIL